VTSKPDEQESRPLILDADEVRGVLDGRKTRHIVPMKATVPGCRIGFYTEGDDIIEFVNVDPLDGDPVDGPEIRCPLGKPGDRLWIRETWHPFDYEDNQGVRRTDYRYRATDESTAECDPRFTRWLSPVIMPHPASRITLEVLTVTAIRLRDISEKDAVETGVRSPLREVGAHLDAFMRALEKKHRKITWKKNPWLYGVTFKRL